MNDCDIGLIRNGFLNRKQNNICIGLKNYDVLMVQQQNAEFPRKRYRFKPQVGHIPYKTIRSGDEF